jgi:hypothetical protein
MQARQTAWVAISVLLLSTQALAEVITRVDRADIDLNESFTLEVIADANIDLQPDISVLEQDFYIGQGSQLSNTTIINGQIRRSKTWTYVLMPKRAGEIIISPISVGAEQSEALVIVVSEPSYAPPGEAEVFVTSDVDFSETYVQAQVLLTIKIYRSVATRQPALRDPTVTGVEVLSELAGEDRSYEAVIDGTAYNVVERVYALYPQESGQIDISAARFEARVLRNGRITGRKVYESAPLTVKVLPIPPRPAEFPDAVWLPARDLQLTESWSRDTAEINAGEPLTRRVTVSALGQLETQIPALEPPTAPGLNIYPDKPELSRHIESGGIRGERKDQYAIIGVANGAVLLPALEVPWWNTVKSEWQVARLAERSVNIISAGEAPVAEPEVAVAVEGETSVEPATNVAMPGEFWRRVSELLVAIWLITLLAWWWTSRPEKKSREPAPVPIHRRQSRHLKEARKAARAGDATRVRKELLEWAALEWPEDFPRSIGALARRVSSPLAGELKNLSSLSYGPNNGDWDGEAMVTAIRSFSVVKDEHATTEDKLPPLMPESAGVRPSGR